MRRTVVAANWKMNMTPSQAEEFINAIKTDINGADNEVFIIPPFTAIPKVTSLLEDTDVKVGAQNLYFEEKGAFTGEISAEMLTDAGVEAVVIGHSERREYFSEDDEIINKKLKKAIEHGLTPILCCGESLETREEGKAAEWIERQITQDFDGIGREDALKCIIAYEPIWAIGTGKVATSDQAEEICAKIREKLTQLYDQEAADGIRILYGGSVNAGNCAELFAKDNIDGGLIGGAGLKPEFTDIVKTGSPN